MDYVLNMPSNQFWAFSKEMQRTSAAESIRELDNAIAPKMIHEYYQERRDRYVRVIYPDMHVEMNPNQEKTDKALSWSDPQAQAMMAKMFRNYRRSKYGR